MTPANQKQVKQFRQDLVKVGINFDPKAFEIDDENYNIEDLLERAEARTSIKEQLTERGLPEHHTDIFISRLQGDTLKEAGWRGRVTPERARQVVITGLERLGKERG